METKLRIVYDTKCGERNFIQGYEFGTYSLTNNRWDVVEDDETYSFEYDACVEMEADGTLNRKSMMDRAEEVEADNLSDYVKAAQAVGRYVSPGMPNYSNKLTEEQLERLIMEDRHANG